MFTIIKYILLIILILLLVVLILLAYLLISAFRYNFCCSLDNKKQISVSVYDPLRLYKINVLFDGMLKVYIRLIFGAIKIPIISDEKKNKSSSKKKNKKYDKNTDLIDSNQDTDDNNTNKSDNKTKEKSKNPTKLSKLIKEFRDEDNRKAFEIILKKLAWILQKIKPRYGYGEISFGFDTPDITGQIVGFISMFSFFYGNKINIYPDFTTDKTFIHGNAGLFGKGRLIFFVIGLVGAYMNKCVVRLFKKLT